MFTRKPGYSIALPLSMNLVLARWKPSSCGEPTFVQSSVVDNKEFVYPNFCVRVSDGLHDHRLPEQHEV